MNKKCTHKYTLKSWNFETSTFGSGALPMSDCTQGNCAFKNLVIVSSQSFKSFPGLIKQ